MSLLILIVVVLVVLTLACWAVSLLPPPNIPGGIQIIQFMLVVIAILVIVDRSGLARL